MANVFEKSEAWLSDQFQEFASVSITYTRGSDSLIFNATPGRSEFPIESNSGVMLAYTTHDWIFPAVLLTFASALPQVGDKIQRTINGRTFNYEVMQQDGMMFWKWCDTTKKDIRVHTKLVG